MSLEGDVDLSQRKGKVIYIFDISLCLKWTGVSSDGKEAKGDIEIKEAMYDSDPNEYEVRIQHHSTLEWLLFTHNVVQSYFGWYSG